MLPTHKLQNLVDPPHAFAPDTFDPVAYCLHQHSGRARACCSWCEQKIRGLTSSVTGGRTRAIRKIAAESLTRTRHRTWWREVAMGRNEGHYLQRIFDLDLPAPVVHR